MPLNPTQAAMLGLLHDAPMTGGDINAAAQKWLAPYYNTTRSQIYRELPILESQGYIKSGTPGSRNSLPYKITGAGKRAFQAWLKLNPASDILRNEAMLRIAFGALHKGDDLQDLLIWMRNHHELRVEEIAGLLNEAAQENMDHDYQALRFAHMYHLMVIGWLETVDLPE